tara:strand:- start:1591 stop:2052 length:462 start_codon:yes stop_codon:yes gene_type:complete
MTLKEIIDITQSWKHRLAWNDYFMSIAFLIGSRSSCNRLHVGCVIVKDTRIISVGYNGFLPKLPHQSYVREGHELATVHAEQNAITDCAKRGVSTHDSTAYITHYPCIHCCKILCASGIKKIYYCSNYKNDPFVATLFQQANIQVNQINLDTK